MYVSVFGQILKIQFILKRTRAKLIYIDLLFLSLDTNAFYLSIIIHDFFIIISV